jgi:hypothetical protein
MALTQVFAAGEEPTATKMNAASIPVVSDPAADIAAPYVGQIVFSTTDVRLYRNIDNTSTGWRVFSGGPTWALSRGTVQSIPNIAWTTMNWTEEDVDTGNMHPANGDTVVINQAGLYAVTAKSSFALNATGIRACRITKNGTADANTVKGSAFIQTIVSAAGIAAVSTPTLYIQCAVNDVLRAQCFQSSGAALNTSVASLGDQTLFTGTWLRD